MGDEGPDAHDQCACCGGDFVAFEKRQPCAKCANVVCARCAKEAPPPGADGAPAAEDCDEMRAQAVVCKDCEFMGKWVSDVKAKDKGRFWNIKMPKIRLRRASASAHGPDKKTMPKSLNQKFSMVSSMLDRTRGLSSSQSQRNMTAIIPSEIQQDLQNLSREKLKELHDQRKLIHELKEENERMRQGGSFVLAGTGGDAPRDMKSLIDELKKESEAHISELQQQIDMLLEQNERLKNLQSLQAAGAAPSAPVPAAGAAEPAAPPEDPAWAKFRKMQKAGLPEGAIRHAAGRDGVELPDSFFDPSAPAPAQSAAAPAAAPAARAVQEDPKFAKYRRMQKAGLPEGAIVQAASRDGVALPATFFSADSAAAAPVAAPAAPAVQEDPKFAKYRRMQKAGLPEGAIAQAASRDGVALPANFFSADAAAAAPAAPAVHEDPKFAKYRKMAKAGLPAGAVMQAASRDGVQLPADFFAAPEGGSPPSATAGTSTAGSPAAPPMPGAGAPAKPAEPPKPKSKYEVTRRADLRRNKDKALRGIFWNVLPAKRVENSFWVKLSDQPPINIDGHLSALETYFAKTEAKKIKQSAAAKPGKAAERPCLLDGKRQQNLGIGLARFKEPVSELRDAVVKMDANFFTMEVVHKLLTMVPTPEEVQAIKAAEDEWSGPGPFAQSLSRVEQFVHEMAKVPRLRQRLQAVFVEMSFERQSEVLLEAIAQYEAGIRQLLNCSDWKKLLHIVLVAGNYLNSTNKSTSGAWGIEVSTGLQKLAQAKATGRAKFTLLHWVAEVADSKAPELFSLQTRLDKLEGAANLKLEDLKTDLVQLVKGCELVERELKASSGETFGVPSSAPGAREFIAAMKPFLLETAKPVTERLKQAMDSLEKRATQILDEHGEIPSKCSASQLLATAHMFCKALNKAREENLLAQVVEDKKSKIEVKNKSGKAKNGDNTISPCLAATSKQLDKQLKVDQLNKKLRNSFRKSGTRTNDSAGAIKEALAKMKRSGGAGIQTA